MEIFEIKDLDDFTRATDQAARLSVQLRQEEAELDRRLQAIRDKRAEVIEQLKADLKAFTDTARKWAKKNRSKIVSANAKFGESPLAVFGFRLGNPTVKLLNRDWDWDSVVDAMLTFQRQDFIRQEQSVNKQAILDADLETHDLSELGLKVTQTETFYITPKTDEEEWE